MSEVKVPVLVPIATGLQGAELEDGLCAGEPPARACYSEAVLDQMTAGTFNDAGGNGQTLTEEIRVVDAGRILVQVGNGSVERDSAACRHTSERCGLPDGGNNVERMPGQELGEDIRNPRVSGLGVRGAEQLADSEKVVDDVNEVEHDGDGHVALGGLSLNVVELVFVAVNEHHVSALAVWVAPLHLVEHVADTRGEVVDDTRGNTLILRTRGLFRARFAGSLSVASQSFKHILGGALVRLLFPAKVSPRNRA